MESPGLKQTSPPVRSIAAAMIWATGTLVLGVTTASPFAILVLTVAVLTLYYYPHLTAEISDATRSVIRGAVQGGDDYSPDTASLADQFMAREFAAAERGRAVTLVMFGVSHFDEFAEREGAGAAAAALNEIGHVLQRTARQLSLSSRNRWRGDAFLTVLSDADAATVDVFTARVHAALRTSSVKMPEINVGTAVYESHIRSPAEFVECAERSLAAAGAAARNIRRAPTAHPAYGTRTRDRLQAS